MKTFLLLLLLCCARTGFAQSFLDFKEAQVLALEGVEFGYAVVNQTPRTVDGVEYTACNIEWYVTNKERFSKVFLLDAYSKSTDATVDLTKKVCLGRLHVSNAIGTSTKDRFSDILMDANMVIEVFRKVLVVKKKNKLEGFNLQPGETLSQSMTVVLPKGQKPTVSLQAFLSTTY
ncbi:MAG: hypothetical protein P0Y53_21340 [Candidatus Pseudobacter hemicellulosilyticus]|uniref:Uncharacterized protein n=1 Tax=Candidatus Pseudobacter hemicellulosilyticus TaxID=3121375 RepID=A0AAJ5WQG0_9BACT|nr:MAG: hypothetical protein P0Y53_21340 [Pseudobacter sp.]